MKKFDFKFNLRPIHEDISAQSMLIFHSNHMMKPIFVRATEAEINAAICSAEELGLELTNIEKREINNWEKIEG